MPRASVPGVKQLASWRGTAGRSTGKHQEACASPPPREGLWAARLSPSASTPHAMLSPAAGRHTMLSPAPRGLLPLKRSRHTPTAAFTTLAWNLTESSPSWRRLEATCCPFLSGHVPVRLLCSSFHPKTGPPSCHAMEAPLWFWGCQPKRKWAMAD